MKKLFGLLFGILLVTPFLAKADLMGFSDGNMYDPATGVWKCLFLMDNNCYDVAQNILTTRPAPADVSTVVSGNNTFTFPTNPLEPTPQPVIVQPTQQPQPVIVQPVPPSPPSQAHLDLQAKCDADDIWYANQIQGFIDSASHNPSLNIYAPGTIVSEYQAKRIARQQQCTQQLANLP